MKNLLSYSEYLGKSKKVNESKTSDFNRLYTMTPTWWNLWKKKNESDYEITQDAFANTYEVKKKDSKDIIFIYDYARFKIFTNETPEIFTIPDDIDSEELKDAEDKDVEDGTGDDTGTSAEGDDETNTEEE